MTVSELAVAVGDVSVAFGGELALRSTSLRVARGEAAALVGPSGCGKSTLLRAIAGLVAPTDGTVELWGVPPGGRGALLGEKRVGITLDEPRLWPWMRADETVVCIAGLGGVALTRRDAVGLLDELGLGDAARRRAGQLSQGMARRVQLAGALAVGADLLLLDEPTASLDAVTASVVWACLERRRAAGVPLVVATHDHGWRGLLDCEAIPLTGAVASPC